MVVHGGRGNAGLQVGVEVEVEEKVVVHGLLADDVPGTTLVFLCLGHGILDRVKRLTLSNISTMGT